MKKALEDFLGGRILTKEVKSFLLENEISVEGPLYRGLPYPKHLLKTGLVIKEWHGSSHWSKDKAVAINFSKDYINEEYEAELLEEMDEVEFVPLVLILDRVNGVDMEPLILQYELLEEFGVEKEVTVFGKDFEVLEIKEEAIAGETYCLAQVKVKES